MSIRHLTILLFSFTFIACKETSKNNKANFSNRPVKFVASIDSILSNDHIFYGDSILDGHKELLAVLFKKYDKDTCVPLIYQKRNLKEGFEGIKDIGDINKDGRTDSIFILSPLNWCEYDDGQSYYFTDTSLPRITSESYCCHPSNFFKLQDFDEDGVCEVGFYHSSCASRYKSLRIVRLHNKQWEEIASSIFDILTQDPEKVKFENLVHKISKNKFRIKTFIDNKKYWYTILIK